MVKVPLLPNLITAFGLSCGLFVIFRISMMTPGAASYAEFQAAVFILLLAAFADVLDGAVARALNVQSHFGACSILWLMQSVLVWLRRFLF